MIIIKRIVNTVISLIFITTNVALANERLSDTASIYKEVMAASIALKNAVINKDIDTLLQYSNPDPLYGYANYLKDINSEEYKYLFDDEWNKHLRPSRRSIYNILTKAKQLEIILEKYELKGKIYVRAYYYDKTKIKLRLPLNNGQASLWGIDFVTCRFTFTGKTWKVAYSIFDYGTDYITNVE